MFNKLTVLYIRTCDVMQCWLMPLLVLFMRIWVSLIFWRSGLVKLSDWQVTLYLFKYEYKVPIIPIEFAALTTTFFEIVCPILIVFGLASRIATLPLIAITGVIYFIYPDPDNVYWLMLLATILFYGPGYVSIDAVLRRHLTKN